MPRLTRATPPRPKFHPPRIIFHPRKFNSPEAIFHLFPRLPAEIQTHIWTFAVAVPRAITLSPVPNYGFNCDPDDPDCTWRVRRSRPVFPPLMHTCREARRVAGEEGRWEVVGREEGRRFWFDFERDVLVTGEGGYCCYGLKEEGVRRWLRVQGFEMRRWDGKIDG